MTASYNSRDPGARRLVRLRRPLPLSCEFYALHYSIEFYSPAGNSGRISILARLPWDKQGEGQTLFYCGETGMPHYLREGFELQVGSIADVIFLRLIRQGDAEEIAGPHCCFEFTKGPEFRTRLEAFRRSG